MYSFRGITLRAPTWCAGRMIAEQDITRLKEVKVRVERLISYYREIGEEERTCVEDLKTRLHGVAAALCSGDLRHG